MVENNRVVSDGIKLPNIFNGYFSNFAENLKLQELENLVKRCCQSEDPIFKVILRYQNHASITAIKKYTLK